MEYHLDTGKNAQKIHILTLTIDLSGKEGRESISCPTYLPNTIDSLTISSSFSLSKPDRLDTTSLLLRDYYKKKKPGVKFISEI